ncbi:hypothetical protein ACJX0J_041473, partial [Zea mays]
NVSFFIFYPTVMEEALSFYMILNSLLNIHYAEQSKIMRRICRKWNINHEILSKYATIINPIKNSISSIRLELSNLGYDFHKIKKFWMNLNFILFGLEILLIEFINFLQGTLM